MGWDEFGEYVSAEEKQRRTQKKIRKLEKAGEKLSPVVATARSIATTFWGKAWCRNLEVYSDYEFRLPRGRSYLRNGAVLDVQIAAGEVRARVMGTSLYEITVHIAPLETSAWKRIKKKCAGGIASTIELLQGRLSEHVMTVITEPGHGLFPAPGEIKMACSCPDWADMCKHVAAVLYGVGVRLDEQPELLFTLRGVDPAELIEGAGEAVAQQAGKSGSRRATTLSNDQLSDVFGIEIAVEEPAPKLEGRASRGRKLPRGRRSRAG